MPHIELVKEDFPEECIEVCSASGPVDAAVDFWIDKVTIKATRADMIQGLQTYGAWERKELQALTTRELKEKILWLACGDFSDDQDYFYMEGA